ncbi:Alpha-galactosidase [Dichanthelium oligosanthes]|uniref:Alpha-galactosidase n=1 Tax=Dichanthelium oligosanthes TaxID=888268 RepID=A0A1E5UWC3_9POAL|nr:Alpha-galactosidase [Dichanthelium oligosanthes]
MSTAAIWPASSVAAVARRAAVENGLGLTPQMGWNSWNHFQCKINEEIIRQIADAMVDIGLAKLGYEYINIDDCWAVYDRDSQGNLAANTSTFPSGIPALADYVHGKGLKLGIYGDAGARTCSKLMPGSLGMTAIADKNDKWASYAGPGGWNDELGVQGHKVQQDGDQEDEVISSVQGELKETVDSHACKMYVVTPK